MLLERKSPINLKPEDEWIFNQWKTFDFPPLKVLVINDAFYNNDGHVWTSNGEEMIKESMIAPGWQITPGPLTIAQKRSCIKTGTPGIIWNCNWNHNYYHFWCDSIPRLLQLSNNKDLEVIVSTYDSVPQRQWVMDILGFKNLKKVTANIIYHSPKIFLPTFNKFANSHQNPILIQKLREIFLPHQGDVYLGDKLYIKRDDRLTKESMEILDRNCEKYGYVQVRLEQYSYKDQISIFNKAKYIIGIHGAGLTNIQWLSTGSHIIELRNRRDNTTPYYYNLVSTIDVNYWYLMGTWEWGENNDGNGGINTARSVMSIVEDELIEVLEAVDNYNGEKPIQTVTRREVVIPEIIKPIIKNDLSPKSRPQKIVRKPINLNE